MGKYMGLYLCFRLCFVENIFHQNKMKPKFSSVKYWAGFIIFGPVNFQVWSIEAQSCLMSIICSFSFPQNRNSKIPKCPPQIPPALPHAGISFPIGQNPTHHNPNVCEYINYFDL